MPATDPWRDPTEFAFADCVQISAPAPGGFGSGRVVGRNLVLTARHVVGALDQPIDKRAEIKVFPYPALRRGDATGIKAQLAWEPERRDDSTYPDIVLLELLMAAGDAIEPTSRLDIARCPAEAATSYARGFPRLVPKDDRGATGNRSTEIAGGRPATNLPGRCWMFQATPPSLLFQSDMTLGVPGEEAKKTAERWSAASGSAVVVEGAIVGVIEKVSAQLMPNDQLIATPIADHADDRLRILLGCAAELPVAGAKLAVTTTAPRDDVRELAAYLYTLDRDDEIRAVELEVESGSAGAIEILVRGHPDDLCVEFWKALWRRWLARGGDAGDPILWPGAGLKPALRGPSLVRETLRAIAAIAPKSDDDPLALAVTR
jgi:hypothetical protein